MNRNRDYVDHTGSGTYIMPGTPLPFQGILVRWWQRDISDESDVAESDRNLENLGMKPGSPGHEQTLEEDVKVSETEQDPKVSVRSSAKRNGESPTSLQR